MCRLFLLSSGVSRTGRHRHIGAAVDSKQNPQHAAGLDLDRLNMQQLEWCCKTEGVAATLQQQTQETVLGNRQCTGDLRALAKHTDTALSCTLVRQQCDRRCESTKLYLHAKS